MIDSTAIILTRDEERNIETCIRRLKGFAARIVVVDSGSTDRTLDIARELGADIFVHEPYVDYGAQFNWAIEHTGIDTEWIMRVDADEYWTPELCAEVEALVQQHAHDDVNGILTESIFFFMGRRILHGERKRRNPVDNSSHEQSSCFFRKRARRTAAPRIFPCLPYLFSARLSTRFFRLAAEDSLPGFSPFDLQARATVL